MAAVLLKSSIRHFSMLHKDCHHVIIGIKPRESVWGGLTASGKYLTAPDRFPQADWQHKFLVTGLNPLIKLHSDVILSIENYVTCELIEDWGSCKQEYEI